MAAAAKVVRVFALSGSLRKASANSALLRYAAAVAPSVGAELFVADAALPLFNQELEPAAYADGPVRAVRALAASCDAVLLATPEYNYSTSPVTSNAIAWLSRGGPEGKSPVAGKAVALVSAGGGLGGMRAQMHARDSLQFLDARVVNKPEVAVPLFSGTKYFDDAGELVDGATQEKVKALLAALVALTTQLAK